MIKPNQLVKIVLDKTIKSTDGDTLSAGYESYFTTEMYPFYSTADEVRKRIGRHINNMPEDTLNQLILTQSQYTDGLTLCTSKDRMWRVYANRYVAALASLTLLENTERFSGALAGGIDKELGDFKIEKKGPTGKPYLIEALQCEIYKLEPAIRYCTPPLRDCLGLTDYRVRDYNPSQSLQFIRGENNGDYPAAGRRWDENSQYPLADDKLKAFGRWYSTWSRYHFWYRYNYQR